MPCLAFVSPLGGVGRTTLAAHSAAVLAQRGLEVMALDLSAQNTLGLHLGLHSPPATGWRTAWDSGQWWAQAALQNSSGLRLLPYGVSASANEDAQVPTQGNAAPMYAPHWLATQLQQLDLPPQTLLVLDTPALPANLAQQALRCADMVVCVLDASWRAVQLHDQLRAYTTQLAMHQRWAVVITGMDPRSSSRRQALAQLRAQWQEQCLPYVIHHDEYLPQAQAQALCVHEFAPQSQAAHDVQGLANWMAHTLRGQEAA